MDALRPDDPTTNAEHQPAPAAVSGASVEDDGAAVVDRLAAYTHEADAQADEGVPEAGEWSESVGEESAAKPRRFGRRRARAPKESTPDEGKARKPKAKKDKTQKRGKKLVGLKIGASQIAAAYVVNNGSPELVEVAREPLEPGVVVSGEIRDTEALGDALERFFDTHDLPKRAVRLGVANNRIGVRTFEIEGVSDPQMLENAIRFRAEEVLPIPLDQAVLDYVVLDEEVREDGSEWRRILLVVAYRDVVDRYILACNRAGIHVVGIDHDAFALLRSLEAPAERDRGAGALVGVAVGHDRTTIAVSTGTHCEFARVLDWGGWSLNVAIARALDRAPNEVEFVKRAMSLSEPTPIEGLTDQQVTQARDAVQRALSGFAREIVSSLQFYQAQPGSHGIGEIVLTGGAAHMQGLPKSVGELVGVPIRLGDPTSRVRVGSKVDLSEQPGSYAIAIGLGIED